MRKLKLDVEALHVDLFDVSPPVRADRGTIWGAAPPPDNQLPPDDTTGGGSGGSYATCPSGCTGCSGCGACPTSDCTIDCQG